MNHQNRKYKVRKKWLNKDTKIGLKGQTWRPSEVLRLKEPCFMRTSPSRIYPQKDNKTKSQSFLKEVNLRIN